MQRAALQRCCNFPADLLQDAADRIYLSPVPLHNQRPICQPSNGSAALQEFKLAALRQDEAAQRAALQRCRNFPGFPADLLQDAADMAAQLGGRVALPVALDALQLCLQEQIAGLSAEGLKLMAQVSIALTGSRPQSLLADLLEWQRSWGAELRSLWRLQL